MISKKAIIPAIGNYGPFNMHEEDIREKISDKIFEYRRDFSLLCSH